MWAHCSSWKQAKAVPGQEQPPGWKAGFKENYSSGLSFQNLHILGWLFEILLHVTAWVVRLNNIFAFLHRTNVAHLVLMEKTKELSCRGGLKERLVRRILLGRGLEGSGSQCTFCSEEQFLPTAAGSIKQGGGIWLEERSGQGLNPERKIFFTPSVPFPSLLFLPLFSPTSPLPSPIFFSLLWVMVLICSPAWSQTCYLSVPAFWVPGLQVCVTTPG